MPLRLLGKAVVLGTVERLKRPKTSYRKNLDQVFGHRIENKFTGLILTGFPRPLERIKLAPFHPHFGMILSNILKLDVFALYFFMGVIEHIWLMHLQEMHEKEM